MENYNVISENMTARSVNQDFTLRELISGFDLFYGERYLADHRNATHSYQKQNDGNLCMAQEDNFDYIFATQTEREMEQLINSTIDDVFHEDMNVGTNDEANSNYRVFSLNDDEGSRYPILDLGLTGAKTERIGKCANEVNSESLVNNYSSRLESDYREQNQGPFLVDIFGHKSSQDLNHNHYPEAFTDSVTSNTAFFNDDEPANEDASSVESSRILVTFTIPHSEIPQGYEIVSDHSLKKQFYLDSTSTSNAHTNFKKAEQSYRCKICSKSFKRNAALKIHSRTHTGEKPYQCNICFKAFNQKSTLKTHVMSHTQERPFQCGICSKTFMQKNTLKYHIMIHTGERPFQCSICMKSFTQRSALASHERTHTGERPFECSVCLKSFSRNFSLKLHEKIHTGEKPYSCKICWKTFSRVDRLKEHERSH